MRERRTRLNRGRARVVRGLVMSAACLLTPTAAHVAAGGGIPIHAGFVFAGLLLAVACVALADRHRSPAEIGALLLLSQPVFHVLLTVAGSHGAGHSVVPSAAMTVAHVVAAAALTIVLSGAEATAWSMASLSATVLLRRTRILLDVPAAPLPPRVVFGDVIPPSYLRRVVSSAPRRGPPLPSSI